MTTTADQAKLNSIAEAHSYESGFNGRLGKYRCAMIAEFTETSNKACEVLEIGSGEGPITEFLAKRFKSVCAIEPAANYFAKLKQRFANAKNIELHHAMFEEINIPRQFPVIVAAGVLEHVADPQAFLKKVSSLLTADGCLWQPFQMRRPCIAELVWPWACSQTYMNSRSRTIKSAITAITIF